MRKTLSTIAVAIVCIFAFVACGTLEDKVSQSELDQMCSELMQNSLFSMAYKDVKIAVKENDVTYSYYYKMSMDDSQIAAVKSQLESSDYKSQIESLKNNFEKNSGIRPNTITYSYYTADDVLIASLSA